MITETMCKIMFESNDESLSAVERERERERIQKEGTQTHTEINKQTDQYINIERDRLTQINKRTNNNAIKRIRWVSVIYPGVG